MEKSISGAPWRSHELLARASALQGGHAFKQDQHDRSGRKGARAIPDGPHRLLCVALVLQQGCPVKERPKPKFKPDDSLAGHPEDIESFWRENPSFIWGPCIVAALVKGLTMIPGVVDFLSEKGMEPYGFANALHYTVYSVVLTYAFHAFVIIHVQHKLKIQDTNDYNTEPRAMAARSTAAICTQLVYSVFPMVPASTSWINFWAWTAVFAVFWDAWFYMAHRYAHEVPWAYKFFHKMHHLNKHPNCFGVALRTTGHAL